MPWQLMTKWYFNESSLNKQISNTLLSHLIFPIIMGGHMTDFTVEESDSEIRLLAQGQYN